MRVIALGLLAAFAFAGLACGSPPASSLTSHAVSNGPQIDFFGSLAPVNSFEWKAAPSYTRNAVVRHLAAVQLTQHKISKAHAKKVLAETDAVRKLLDSAVATCAQENRTGQCTGDKAAAQASLAKANAALAAIH